MKDEISVPPILENLGVIGEFLQERTRGIRFPTRKTWELLLAMDEVCSQIIQFRAFDRSMSKLQVRWEDKPDRVEISIETEGIPFNPLKINKYNAESEAEEKELGGMGLYLVNQMLDETSYVRAGRRNILKLVKLRKGRGRKPAPVKPDIPDGKGRRSDKPGKRNLRKKRG